MDFGRGFQFFAADRRDDFGDFADEAEFADDNERARRFHFPFGVELDVNSVNRFPFFFCLAQL